VKESKQFFFEKRTKKLLTYVEPTGAKEERCGRACGAANAFLSADRLNITKSFLLLFFKKELLPLLRWT
jgi:hypothetical protein